MMSHWVRKHRFITAILSAMVALGAAEAVLVYYYLSSWFILPLL